MWFVIYFAVILLVALIAVWLRPKPLSLSQMCDEADKQFGEWPIDDPYGQVAWALRALDSLPGAPTCVDDIVQRRIWCALVQFRRPPDQPELTPMLAALRRAKEMYERERDAYPADDYNSTFPDDDARLIGEAMQIVSTSPVTEYEQVFQALYQIAMTPADKYNSDTEWAHAMHRKAYDIYTIAQHVRAILRGK